MARTTPSAMIRLSRRSPSAASLAFEQAARGAVAVLLGHRHRADHGRRRAPGRWRPAPGARRARGRSRRSARSSPLISAIAAMAELDQQPRRVVEGALIVDVDDRHSRSRALRCAHAR